jgi:hemolysin-activating ACP:hemolysin acyltransferase
VSIANDKDRAVRSDNRSKPIIRNPNPQQVKPADEPTGLTEKVRRDATSLRNSLAFTQAVGVLMRSSHYKEYKIGDLEWLLLPAITNRQFRIGEVKLDEAHGGATVPASLVLWAFVSPEVDKRLTETTEPKLTPAEWTSGDIPWLVHAAGETRFVRPVVDQLMATTFKGRTLKILGRDKDNNIKIHILDGSKEASKEGAKSSAESAA